MKTLYEILEVSEKASKEIIEKAYKVLAKKYHPDLQQEGERKNAEEQMKLINEAYEILSNDTKRQAYDNKLMVQREEEKIKNQTAQATNNNYEKQTNFQQNNYTKASETPKTSYNNQQTNNQNQYNNDIKYTKQQIENEYRQKQEELQREYERQYQQAYEGYLRNLGYRIKYKWTWKRIKDLLKTIAIILVIILIIWFFPPTHKILVEFYESNLIVQSIVNIIAKILNVIWQTICSLFK